MSSRVKIVIPARYGSTRLPGKPLAEMCGKTMIQRVWENAMETGFGDVIIATDHVDVFEHCQSFGAEVRMTPKACVSGSERIAAVAIYESWEHDDVVINLQGDEPFLPVDSIRTLISDLEFGAGMCTLAHRIYDGAKVQDPNLVKVVLNKRSEAIYFSRSPIPYIRDKAEANEAYEKGIYLGHIGIYGYRVGVLKQMVRMGESEIERLEQLEQLRALDSCIPINVQIVPEPVMKGIDTPEDLRLANEYLLNGK